MDYVRSDKYRCDEVGLFLFARMFHIQIGVIVNAVVWTTHAKQDLLQCDIILGYKGNCEFVLLKDFEPGDEPIDTDITELPPDSMLSPTPATPVQSVPVKQKIQRKAIDLTKATDRFKKDKRNKKRREQRKIKNANKKTGTYSYGLRSKDNSRKTRNSQKASFYSASNLLRELFQQNKVHWKLWMSTCPRGRSVQNLTLVFGVKNSSLNTNY